MSYRRRSRGTTPPQSSTKSASTWTPGAACRTRPSGRSHRKPRGCSSTGATTISSSVRPFFCQIEAVETTIWLTEVAPRSAPTAKFLRAPARRQRGSQSGTVPPRAEDGDRQRQDHCDGHADRLADGERRPPPDSKHFSRGFLIVTPGITIRDRLRVLLAERPGQLLRTGSSCRPTCCPTSTARRS